MKVMLSLLVAGVAMAAAAEKQPRDRYQTIVERQMFGRVPAGFDPTKPPSTLTPEERKKLEQQQEKLRSAIRLSAINIKPNGRIAVGFTDSGVPSKPMHYYLGVGESRDGWLVKEADPKTAVAVIAKGEVEITLTLGEDSAKKADATARAGQSRKTADAASAADSASETAAEETEARPRSFAEMRERRRRQMEKERKQDEADRRRRAQEAEAQRAERENMKLELEDLRNQIEQSKFEREEQRRTEEAAGKNREEQSAAEARPEDGGNGDGENADNQS